jgi:XTP/dITP diphosphohydrolase
LELLVATKNKKKLGEIGEILKEFNLTLTSLVEYPRILRIVEDGRTFKANAIKKALKSARVFKKLSLGEDSGLCVDALGGNPGVRSSRFAGNEKSDAKNNSKLLVELDGLPINKRKAYYVCAVALADEKGLIGVVEGRCSGFIGFAPKGHFGFGYDPLFIVAKYKKTFAELGPEVKHKISHRFRALNKCKRLIEKYIERHSLS